jgi:hypothetical protein
VKSFDPSYRLEMPRTTTAECCNARNAGDLAVVVRSISTRLAQFSQSNGSDRRCMAPMRRGASLSTSAFAHNETIHDRSFGREPA